MGEDIRFNCPECGKRLKAKPENVGKQARCSCGSTLVVPVGNPVGGSPGRAVSAPPPAAPAPSPPADRPPNPEPAARAPVRPSDGRRRNEAKPREAKGRIQQRLAFIGNHAMGGAAAGFVIGICRSGGMDALRILFEGTDPNRDKLAIFVFGFAVVFGVLGAIVGVVRVLAGAADVPGVRVSLPPGWETGGLQPLTKGPSGKCPTKDAYFLVIAEPKARLAATKTPEGYAALILDLEEKNRTLKDRRVSPAKKITVHGYAAVQHDITGTMDALELAFVKTFVALPTYFCQVTCWTTRANFDMCREDFKAILESLEGDSV